MATEDKIHTLIVLANNTEGFTVDPAEKSRLVPGTVVFFSGPVKPGEPAIRLQERWPSKVDVRFLHRVENTLKKLGFNIKEAEQRFKADEMERRKAARDKLRGQEEQTTQRANAAAAARQAEKQAASPEPDKGSEKRDDYIEHFLCTPDIALELYTTPRGPNSPKERPIRRGNVKRFKKIIEEDRWEDDYMLSDEHGYVFNGRHRLLAISEGEKSVPVSFVRNAPQRLFTVIDTPAVRDGADTLASLHDLTKADAIKLSSAVKYLNDFYNSNKSPSSWGRSGMENDLIAVRYDEMPDLMIAMERAKVLYEKSRKDRSYIRVQFTPRASIVFCFLVAEAWPGCGVKLDEFMQAVAFGEGVPDNPKHAVAALRTRMWYVVRDREKLGDYMYLAYLLTAWKRFLLDEDTIGGLRWTQTTNKETGYGFPSVIKEAQVPEEFLFEDDAYAV